ncbi:MAG: EAL domain-containing protein [Pseudomonadota bacterium]
MRGRPAASVGDAETASADPMERIAALEQDLAREREARAVAEALVAERASELHQTNLRLRELNRDLEHTLTERTRSLQSALDEAQEATRALRHASRHDALTRLPNRRYLSEFVEQELPRRTGYGPEIGFLQIDLDRFKQINDTLGHAAGDHLLSVIARRLTEISAPDGFVARTGGDEFVVLTQVTGGMAEAMRLAERIVAEVPRPVQFEGTMLRFGVSVGVAVAARDGFSLREQLIRADLALYRSKEAGRGRANPFTPDLLEAMNRRRRIADDLEVALEDGQIRPVYHPRIDPFTGGLCCVEALARWYHPELGMIMPGHFLDVAEDVGLSHRVDHVVLQRAIGDLTTWRSAGLEVPRLSVNVTYRHLMDRGLIGRLREIEIPRDTLSFELLETVVIDDGDTVLADRLSELRALGIDLEIDDFGSGQASILSLLRVRPRTLKIDRALVLPMVEDPATVDVGRAVVAIGKALGLTVVAEGVETADHWEICRALGCDQIQGYAVARPMEASEFAVFASMAADVARLSKRVAARLGTPGARGF